jgi:ribulose-phosphate 3-epimerase
MMKVSPSRIRVAPSLLAADFSRLGEEIKKVETAGADLIHFDIMDGHFVPAFSMGPLVVKACRNITSLPFDVHLMVENPDKFIPYFAEVGANLITIHVEASKSLDEDIESIRRCGVLPGLVVNPATAIEKVFPYLDRISMILIMSVKPGFGGQPFMPEVLPKIRALSKERGRLSLDFYIEVDGGINPETAGPVIRAGADTIVAGSAIFGSQDYKETICRLKKT